MFRNDRRSTSERDVRPSTAKPMSFKKGQQEDDVVGAFGVSEAVHDLIVAVIFVGDDVDRALGVSEAVHDSIVAARDESIVVVLCIILK